MPGLNGPEAFAQMTKLRPGIPVIFTTGYATEVNLIAAQSQVHPAILQKPYGTLVLAERLRGILDEKKRRTLRDEDRSD